MSSDGKSHSLAKVAEPFVCGGAAATFASIIIHPIDLAKGSTSLLLSSSSSLLLLLLLQLLQLLLFLSKISGYILSLTYSSCQRSNSLGSHAAIWPVESWKANPFIPKAPFGDGEKGRGHEYLQGC
jgi:hypothetical protein